MATILNAKNTPVNVRTGTMPDVSGGMLDWFQPMIFELVTKTAVGYQVEETGTEIAFRGILQPLSGRELMLKPEGQRTWNWVTVHSDDALKLNVDEVIKYQGTQYRVMTKKSFGLYGYQYYELIQDWTGSGPVVSP